MSKFTVQSLIALLLTANVALLPAAAPVIGTAIANGSITLDNARTPGNAPLFEGNTIETGSAASRLQLNSGASVQLASGSKGKIYSNRLVLEKGSSQLRNSKGYEIDAASLRISGADARVSMRGQLVQVASLNGTVNVANANGVILASLAPGRALDFTPQAGAGTSSTLTGCLMRTGDVYTLTDETSNVTAQLKGSGLGRHVGHRISVTGAMDSAATAAGGASQVVNVSNINMLSNSCTAGGAAGAAAAGGAAAGGATAAGAVAGVSTAIVAGVVVAAAVGVTAGVLATQGESTPTQTVSPSRP